MRHQISLAVASLLMASALAACAPSYHQEFAVTGASPAPAGTEFRNSDPKINDVEARAYCADGYDKLSTQTQPSDSGPIEEWRVRCKPYTVSLLPF